MSSLNYILTASILLLICFYKETSAQTQAEIDLLKNIIPEETPVHYHQFTKGNNSEYELLFSGLFLLYKKILSSQDIPTTCFFTPSCSEYAMQSIKKRGIFIGVIIGIERISRCNGLENSLYTKDEITGRYIDYP